MMCILLFLFSMACTGAIDSAEEPDADYLIQTDRKVYVAEQDPESTSDRPFYSFEMIATFENRTEDNIYLERCHNLTYPIYGIGSVSRQKDVEQAAFDPVWGCMSGFIEVESGEVRTDTLHMRGPGVYDQFTGEHFGRLEGRFYLAYYSYNCPSVDDCGPAEELRSSRFEVSLSR
jgi:hypothetical protein